MEGNLVIVESPAKAKTIQKYLGDGFVVKSSQGHIRDLQEKKLSIDIDNGFTPEYVIPDDKKKKLVSDLKKAAKNSETVWLASDEDREGEAISWHLVEALDLDPAKTKRIVFHEITKTAIQKAIENPRTIDMNLVNAQQARRVLDRLVGFELSPVLWRKVKRGLSAGRVQSVALRLVVDREREINAFTPEPFYRIQAVFHPQGTDASVKLKARLDNRFNGIEEARTFLSDCIGATFCVDSVDSTDGTRHPAPPFTTSTLQQEAARKLHMSVSSTMRIAQGLYERGLITYMRTDSTNLSNLALGTAKEYITETYGSEYSHTRQFRTTSKGAQEAHEAIRPTFISNTDIEGTSQEKKLYNLIWKRTVASQMEDAKVVNTTVRIGNDHRSEKFSAQAATILFDGFLKVYAEGIDDESEDSEEAMLPETMVGAIMEAKTIGAECKYTQAPPRFSEATLVKKLEELGIGRPSTYAPTISTLMTREYIFKGDHKGTETEVVNLTLKGNSITEAAKIETYGNERSKLLPQDSGMQVCDYLCGNFSDIMDYEFTANVEKEFDDIAEGNTIWNEYIGRFYGPFHGKVDEVLKDRDFVDATREIGIDPSDGKKIFAKRGQYGPYVQKGEGDDRQYASLLKNQLIESISLEEAIKLFQLPRTVGQLECADVVVLKGRFGPYIKFNGSNFSLPKGSDPLSISLEECVTIIKAAAEKPANDVLAEFPSGIQLINGRYGPYIKFNGSNYKIPRGTEATALDEAACREIINNSQPTSRRGSRARRS